MTAYVALLRGVNLGSTNKVPMKELRSVVEGLGHEGVRTYLQSGNVVFTSRSSTPRRIAGDLEAALADAFGLDISVILRTSSDLRRIARGNPFATEGVKGTFLHVMFLAEPPSSQAVESLEPDRSPPDEFRVKGSEVYLWFPGGSGKSKLTLDYFERQLETRATARNWNTVTKLLELVDGS